MFGLEWMNRGGMERVLILTSIWTIVVLTPICLGIYYGLQKPNEEHWAKVLADDKLKTQQEHGKLVSMDCKQLGDWLLQDNVWDHDNLIWAQNHYLVSCK